MKGGAALLGLALGCCIAASSHAEPAGSGSDAAPHYEDLAPSGPSVLERLGEIRRRVQAALVYPELARSRGIQGEARVAFEIGADGHPLNVTLVESSGSRSLDRAAEHALLAAGALPYVAGRVTVPVRFGLVRSD